MSESKIEQIMKVQNIGELPQSEKDFLRDVSRVKEIECKVEEETPSKVPEKVSIEEEKETMLIEGEIPPEDVDLIIDYKIKDTDETKELEWLPQCAPEDAPINIEEYKAQKIDAAEERIETKKQVDSKKVEVPTTFEECTLPKETLSKEARVNIGRWGEEYALRCIREELDKKYPNTTLEETEQGFRLVEGGNIIAEVIWLNKENESGKHFDIKIIENGEEIFVEVKSTKEYGKAWFKVSKDQWNLIKEKGKKFCVYRIYGAGTKKVKLEKIQNPAKLWLEGHIDAYPIGIEL
jgi:hypothetical protein